MLFHFQLHPVDEIAPWTVPSQGNRKYLSWFSLTDGCYWLDVVRSELFRYNTAILEHWAKAYPESRIEPHADHQVVRLWEDTLYMLPAVLEPVPEDLARHVQSGGIWESWAAWKHWKSKASTWIKTQDDDAWELFSVATDWWGARRLDTASLGAGPGIWFWREGDVVYVRWDNRDILLDGLPVWIAEAGEISMTADAFLEEVRSFDERLISAMAERVDAARDWRWPEIRLDWNGLREEHRRRSTALSGVLTHPPLSTVPTDWSAVRAALFQINEAMK